MYSRLAKTLVMVVAVSVPIGAPQAEESGYANPHLIVSVSELAALIEASDDSGPATAGTELRLIDTRSHEKFLGGHLPGAINIPFRDMTDPKAHVAGALKSDRALAELFGRSGISRRSHVVVYDDEGGFRASRLFWVLEYFGHQQVSLLDGGIQTWTARGHELQTPKAVARADAARDERPIGTSEFSVNLMPRRHASADYILDRRRDANTVVVDVRPTSAYDKGHIPWAISMPWKGNLTEDGLIKSSADLIARYDAAGVTPEANVVVHCQTGEASAHTYFTLRLLGYPRVRTYHRSWAEWGASDDLPKS